MPESSPCLICRAGLREWVADRQDEVDEYKRLVKKHRKKHLTELETARLSRLEREFDYEKPPKYGVFLRTLWSDIEGNPDRVCDTCRRHRLDVRHHYCPVCGGTFRIDLTL